MDSGRAFPTRVVLVIGQKTNIVARRMPGDEDVQLWIWGKGISFQT